MHKVKGLEFDVVITTPSFAGLPLRPHREYEKGENPNVDDLADMNEERRLMFVAYTRAKKRLIIYKAERERSLSQSSIYIAPDYPALRYTEPKPGLDKYYLSYTAQSRIFENVDSYVLNQIKKDDPVHIVRDQYGNYFIVHNGHYIGRLSSRSTIRYRAEVDGKTLLNDFLSATFLCGRMKIHLHLTEQIIQILPPDGHQKQNNKDILTLYKLRDLVHQIHKKYKIT